MPGKDNRLSQHRQPVMSRYLGGGGESNEFCILACPGSPVLAAPCAYHVKLHSSWHIGLASNCGTHDLAAYDSCPDRRVNGGSLSSLRSHRGASQFSWKRGLLTATCRVALPLPCQETRTSMPGTLWESGDCAATCAYTAPWPGPGADRSGQILRVFPCQCRGANRMLPCL